MIRLIEVKGKNYTIEFQVAEIFEMTEFVGKPQKTYGTKQKNNTYLFVSSFRETTISIFYEIYTEIILFNCIHLILAE